MAEYEVRYVGPGPAALEVGRTAVELGGTASVDEAEAARLVGNGAWELVGGPKKRPQASPSGDVTALAVPDGDVHEHPAEAPAEEGGVTSG